MHNRSNQSGHKRTLLAFLAFSLILIAPALTWRNLRAQESGSRPARSANDPAKYTNKLIGESSPYLLEHAHNPVNWYPWGVEALERAQRENKPIFVSVGYSACHWCHVMAREDFENEEIAGILNTHFVAIKVDREQRPDIDAQYMLALQMMTGSGGWPMSVFLTPDRKPFFGGTYFPPEEFKGLLNKIVELYAKQPEALQAQADRVAAALSGASRSTAGSALPQDVLGQAELGLRRRFDMEQGGFAQRPKFPEASNLVFLLARYHKTGDRALLSMVTTTLDHMAEGGIYDQLGGGFHRYSTDAVWRVPHFEKMLYDQAQLVLVYLDAYQVTRKPRYRQVVEETLAFVTREMRGKDGGFYSTIDADSEGEEGKFYLWTPDQVKKVLGDDASLFDNLYGVTGTGDLEGKSVLHVVASAWQPSKTGRHGASYLEGRLEGRIETMRRKMLAARDKRERPRTDDKVLANWNGLMIAAYARAYQVLADARYRQTAADAANFLAHAMMTGGLMRHSYRAGKSEVDGMLEDYAFCAYGLLALYDATHEKPWLDRATELATRMTTGFKDAQNGGFYTTASQGDLLTRLKECEDNATPSGNGAAAMVLARLAALTGNAAWRTEATQTIQAFQPLEARTPSAFPTLLTAYQTLGSAPAIALPPSVVQVHAAPVDSHPGSDVTVTMHLAVKPGWHINAHKTSADYLIATTLSLAESGDAKLVRVEYPDGQKARFAFASDSVSVYQGDAVLKATLHLSSSAHRGRRFMHFALHYQPCSDRACLAPADTEIVVLLNIL